jgi:hypothetical protein
MDVALVERNVLDIQLVGGAPCLVQVKVSSLALVQVERAICCVRSSSDPWNRWWLGRG